MPTFGELTSVGGYKLGEVSSALQKTIRRGKEEEALFWATELDLSGYGAYCWKRLKIITTEDIGMANPDAIVQVETLHKLFLEIAKKHPDSAKLFLLQAVMLLARSPKSRMTDNALMVFYEGKRPHPEIPDYALDMHTGAGRRMGRGLTHFFEEGVQLDNQTIEDPYRERGELARRGDKAPRPPVDYSPLMTPDAEQQLQAVLDGE